MKVGNKNIYLLLLIKNYKNAELKLKGIINKDRISLSLIEISTGESINLKPLPCSVAQIGEFVSYKHDRIALVWGLVNPDDPTSIIIPTADSLSPPSQIEIRGFEIE